MSKEEPIPGLRDFIAVSALSVLGNNIWVEKATHEGIAEFCYTIADAMLVEREKNAVTK